MHYGTRGIHTQQTSLQENDFAEYDFVEGWISVVSSKGNQMVEIEEADGGMDRTRSESLRRHKAARHEDPLMSVAGDISAVQGGKYSPKLESSGSDESGLEWAPSVIDSAQKKGQWQPGKSDKDFICKQAIVSIGEQAVAAGVGDPEETGVADGVALVARAAQPRASRTTWGACLHLA